MCVLLACSRLLLLNDDGDIQRTVAADAVADVYDAELIMMMINTMMKSTMIKLDTNVMQMLLMMLIVMGVMKTMTIRTMIRIMIMV